MRLKSETYGISNTYYQKCIYAGGEAEGDRNYEDQILKYVPSDDKWERVGTIRNKRKGHSVAVINVKDYCH